MELLPHDVIEDILARLDVKTLVKFMSVSKQCKSTIQSPFFQKRQLIHHRKQFKDPNVLLVSLIDMAVCNSDIEALRTLVVVGSSSESVQIPTPWENKDYQVCNTSCDGLIFLNTDYDLPSIVVNPTTRWHRILPFCHFERVPARPQRLDGKYPSPGFGKEKINGTYKPVWLYNSAQLGLNDDATTCEVFDFDTNAWRYVVPASTHLIYNLQDPVYLDGSLHWFTALSSEGKTMVLSLDLHTETFQVIAKAPFLHVYDDNMIMCNLGDRLCVSEEKWPQQVIWSLDSEHKTWKIIYSIDLVITSSLFPTHMLPYAPLAVLDKDKLLFYDRESGDKLVVSDDRVLDFEYATENETY